MTKIWCDSGKQVMHMHFYWHDMQFPTLIMKNNMVYLIKTVPLTVHASVDDQTN